MANDPRSTIQHPNPMRPDDPLVPNPGDLHSGHPDPATPSAGHPAQQRADQAETSEPGARRQMTSEQGPKESTRSQRATGQPKGQSKRQQAKGQQGGWQMSPDQQQLTDYRRGKHRQQSAAPTHADFGDPSPGDENPRELPIKPQRS